MNIFCEIIYYTSSFIRAKNKWKNKASCYYHIMHLLKFDTRVWRLDWRCYITPFFSCLITMWRCSALFSPTFFLALINEEVRYILPLYLTVKRIVMVYTLVYDFRMTISTTCNWYWESRVQILSIRNIRMISALVP